MEQTRVFRMDGDEVAVLFRYSEKSNQHLGAYPDFVIEPRYTPNGRPWVNVTMEGCLFAPQPYNDCGSCDHLRKESEQDLIGVCFHAEKMRSDGDG